MNELTADRLRELVEYLPETGFMTRFAWRGRGGLIGTTDKRGHRKAKIGHKLYAVHRLAWLYMTGEWPRGVIDHINGNPGDNRWINLRDVEQAVNAENQTAPQKSNRTGFLGVSAPNKSGKYRATIQHKGKCIYLGVFPSPNDAHEAYVMAKREIHAGCTL